MIDSMLAMLRTFYKETASLPRTIELPRRVWIKLHAECAKHPGSTREYRPGPLCHPTEDRMIDAGNPAIELETGHGRVRIIPDAAVYQSELR